MMTLIRRVISYRFFPLAWTLFTITLLCIPGSVVPGTHLFDIEHLDKVVHIILFGTNVLFWGFYFLRTARPRPVLKKIFILATLGAIALGIAMEFVQLYFVPYRTFDGGDIIADAVGAVAAGWWLLRS